MYHQDKEDQLTSSVLGSPVVGSVLSVGAPSAGRRVGLLGVEALQHVQRRLQQARRHRSVVLRKPTVSMNNSVQSFHCYHI